MEQEDERANLCLGLDSSQKGLGLLMERKGSVLRYHCYYYYYYYYYFLMDVTTIGENAQASRERNYMPSSSSFSFFIITVVPLLS